LKFLLCEKARQKSDYTFRPNSLTAVSIMFCSRPTETSPIASWIHRHLNVIWWTRCCMTPQTL